MDVKFRISCFNLLSFSITIALLLSDKCTFSKSLSDGSSEVKPSDSVQYVESGENPLEVTLSNQEIFTKKEDESQLNTPDNIYTPLEEKIPSEHYGVSFVRFLEVQNTNKIKAKTKRSANYSPIYPHLPSAPTQPWSQSNYNPSAPNYPYQSPNSYQLGNQNATVYYPTPQSGQFYPNAYNSTQKPGYNQPSSFYPPHNPSQPYQPNTFNNGPNGYYPSNAGNFNYVNCSSPSPYGTPNRSPCPSSNTFFSGGPGQSTYRPNNNPSYPPPNNWNRQQGATTLRYPTYNNTYSQRPPQYNYTHGQSYTTPHSYNYNPTNINNSPYNRPNSTSQYYPTPSYGQNPYQTPYNGSANNYGQNSQSHYSNPYSPSNPNGYNQNGPQNYNPGQAPLAPYPPNSNFANSKKPYNPADMTYPPNSNNPHHRY